MDQKFHFDENIEPFTFQPTYQFFPEGEDIEMKLYASLKESLNYILSKENIPDFFPNVVFDSMETQDIFIDLKDILNVPLIENMTTDKNFVIKVIQENKKYTIDENNFVKVNLSDRTTIMLRDIPEGTLPEEIKNLFGEFAEQIANMEPEIGNNYYVNFDTTEIAQNAFNHVRTKTFNGKNVGCCITTNFTKKKISIFLMYMFLQSIKRILIKIITMTIKMERRNLIEKGEILEVEVGHLIIVLEADREEEEEMKILQNFILESTGLLFLHLNMILKIQI